MDLVRSGVLQIFGFEWFVGICFVMIGLLVIFLLIAFWVYQDAESRGMSGLLWFVVVFLLPLIGLILYLILRTERPSMPYAAYAPQPAPPPVPSPPPVPPAAAPAPATSCQHCGATLLPNASFCAQCGAKV